MSEWPEKQVPTDEELARLAAVSEEAVNPTPPDPSAMISGNVRCVFCGYNLYTIARGGHCPECGKPAEGSLRGDALAYSNPEWTRKLAIGATMIAWQPVCWVLAFFMGMAGARGASRSTIYLFIFMQLVAGIFYAVGLWLLTTPEPGGANENGKGIERWRILARVGGLLHAIGQSLMVWLLAIELQNARIAVEREWLFWNWLGCVIFSLYAAAPWTGRLANRTYQKGLGSMMKVACVAAGTVIFLLALWMVGYIYFPNSVVARVLDQTSCFAVSLWMMFAVAALPLFVLAWFKLSFALRRAATLARVHEIYPNARVKE